MHQHECLTAPVKIQNTRSFIDPLTSVRLLAELLRDYPDLDKGQRRLFVDLILNSTDRLIHLVGSKA